MRPECPIDDLEAQRNRKRRERAAMLVMRNHRGIAQAQEPRNMLLGKAHPPAVQNQIILCWFDGLHSRRMLCGQCSNSTETVKAGKVVENYRSRPTSVSNLCRSRSRFAAMHSQNDLLGCYPARASETIGSPARGRARKAHRREEREPVPGQIGQGDRPYRERCR